MNAKSCIEEILEDYNFEGLEIEICFRKLSVSYGVYKSSNHICLDNEKEMFKFVTVLNTLEIEFTLSKENE